MPVKDRLERDEECPPALERHHPARKATSARVRRVETRTGDLTAEHSELLAEHHDLGVLGYAIHPVDPDQLQHAADQAVEERERHGAAAWRAIVPGHLGDPRVRPFAPALISDLVARSVTSWYTPTYG